MAPDNAHLLIASRKASFLKMEGLNSIVWWYDLPYLYIFGLSVAEHLLALFIAGIGQILASYLTSIEAITHENERTKNSP